MKIFNRKFDLNNLYNSLLYYINADRNRKSFVFIKISFNNICSWTSPLKRQIVDVSYKIRDRLGYMSDTGSNF